MDFPREVAQYFIDNDFPKDTVLSMIMDGVPMQDDGEGRYFDYETLFSFLESVDFLNLDNGGPVKDLLYLNRVGKIKDQEIDAIETSDLIAPLMALTNDLIARVQSGESVDFETESGYQAFIDQTSAILKAATDSYLTKLATVLGLSLESE